MVDWIQIVMAPAGGEPAPSYPLQQTIMMFLIIGVLFWLIILRPQKREQESKRRLVESAEKGDRVVTIGGIHGTVVGADTQHNTVTVDVGKNVKIEFSRQAISSIEKKKKSSPDTAKGKDSG